MDSPRATTQVALAEILGNEGANEMLAPIDPFFDAVVSRGILAHAPTRDDIVGMEIALLNLFQEPVWLDLVCVSDLPEPPAGDGHDQYCTRHRLDSPSELLECLSKFLGDVSLAHEEVLDPAFAAMRKALHQAFVPDVSRRLSAVRSHEHDSRLDMAVDALMAVFTEYLFRASLGQRDMCRLLAPVLSLMPRILLFTQVWSNRDVWRALTVRA